MATITVARLEELEYIESNVSVIVAEALNKYIAEEKQKALDYKEKQLEKSCLVNDYKNPLQ